MNTNYKEQLAWYESTVKPYAVTPIATKTRVWHASATKPRQPFDLMRKSSKSNLYSILHRRIYAYLTIIYRFSRECQIRQKEQCPR